MDNNLFEQAKNDDILSKELISFLLESMEYSRLSFINDAVVQRIINNCYIKPMPLPLH